MHIAVFALLIGVLIIPLGMDGIDGKIGMMPVDQKIIKADMQSFLPEDVHMLLDEIPPGGSICAPVIRIHQIKIPYGEH